MWKIMLSGMRVLVAGALCLALTPLAAALTYQQAQALAREQAPALHAARARVQGARELLAPADALPDPTLVLGVDNLAVTGADAFSFDGDRMTMRRIAVSQEIPNRTKRRARLQTAEAVLAQTALEQDLVALAVARQVADAWLRRQASDAQLLLLDQLQRDNRLLAEAVSAQVSAGELRAVDAVLPQQEAAQIANRRDSWQAEQRSAIAELQRWIGEAASQPLAGTAPQWSIEEATLLAHLEQHAELQHAALRVDVQRARVREAQAEKRPDWGVTAGFMKRADDYSDMAMLELRIELPLFGAGRQGPRIAAAHAEQQAAAADQQAVQQQHEAMLRSEMAEYRRLHRAWQRQQQQLVPLAHDKVELMRAAWQGANATLAELMSARLQWLDARSTLITLERDWRRQAAQLYYRHAPAYQSVPTSSALQAADFPPDSAQQDNRQ